MQLGALEYLISLNSNNLGNDIKKADNKLTSWAVAKGQMIGRVMEKAMASAGDSLKKVIGGAFNNFADYEQLVGGVETLFKDTAVQVQKFAKEAYKTAGISANEYMQTVTSFSASLLQSLGGDTDKAADYADMAIRDMADNANKMGSTMESIQNAYQGFAKQNYTMLDNLKLGYGGTKTEMQRLLKDAGKLTNRTFDITKLSDVYEAIHIIQQEMDITGTTQLEAEKTISGSINTAKAAWKDLLTAMGSGQDVQGATKRFAESAQTVIKNATPVIQRTINSILITAKTIWPSVKKAINDIWKSTVSTIKGLMPKGVRQLMNIGGTMIKRLTNAFKKDGLKGITKELKNIGSTFKVSLAEWLEIDNPEDASWGNIASKIAQGLKKALKKKAVKIMEMIGIDPETDGSWIAAAEKVLNGIKTGIGKAADNLKLKIADILGIENDGDVAWSTIGSNIIERIKNGITNGANSLKMKVADILGIENDGDVTWSAIGGDIIDRIKNGIANGTNSLKLKIADLLGIEADGDVTWSTIGSDIVTRIKGGIANGTNSLKLKIADILGIENDGDVAWSTIGSDIVGRIKTGISNGTSSLKLKIADILGIEEEGDPSWATIGGEISTRLKKGVESAKLKLADLLGIDDAENATWGDIGTKIAEGIGSAFTKGKSYLLKFLLGGDYDESKSDWAQVGEKISGWIEDGFKENGWATKFLAMFGEKWEAIFNIGGTLIQSVADWLSDSANSGTIVNTIVSILTTVANSAGKIVVPFAEALINIISSPDFVGAISSLASTLIDMAVAVFSSPDLWNALSVLADNLLRTILGDSIADSILGNKKKLEYYNTYEEGKKVRRTRVVEDKENTKYNKSSSEKGMDVILGLLGLKKGGKYFGIDSDFGNDLVQRAFQFLLGGETGRADLEAKDAATKAFVEMQDTFDRSGTLKASAEIVWGSSAPTYAGMLKTPKTWMTQQTRAKGDWNVSHDMLAQLHQGEMVLTKSQARKYREGSEDVDYTVIGGMIGSAVERSFKRVNVLMSGEKVGDLTTRRVRKNLNAQSYARLRALGG